MTAPATPRNSLPQYSVGDRLTAADMNTLIQLATDTQVPARRGEFEDQTSAPSRRLPFDKTLTFKAELLTGEDEVPEYSVVEVHDSRHDDDGIVLIVRKPTDEAQVFAGNEGVKIPVDGQGWVKLFTEYSPVLVNLTQDAEFLSNVQPDPDDQYSLKLGSTFDLVAVTPRDSANRAHVVRRVKKPTSSFNGRSAAALKLDKDGTLLQVYPLGAVGTTSIDASDGLVYLGVANPSLGDQVGVLDEASGDIRYLIQATGVLGTGYPLRVIVTDDAIFYTILNSLDSSEARLVKRDKATMATSWTKTGVEAGNTTPTIGIYGVFNHNLAVDEDGNSYVCAKGGGLKKYDPAGALLLTITDTWRAEAIAIDSAGNIYIASSPSVGSKNLRKYDASGSLVWDALVGVGTTTSNAATSLAITSLDEVLVTTKTGVMALYSSAGSQLWITSALTSPLWTCCVDEDDACYCAGNYGIVITSSYKYQYVTVYKYDHAGVQEWTFSAFGAAGGITYDLRAKEGAVFVGLSTAGSLYSTHF